MNELIDDLLLLSGNDLPFPQGNLTIHQPKLKQIAYITEERFWIGCEFLRFDKNSLASQDKVSLQNQSNFNILLTVIKEKDYNSEQIRLNIMSLLALLFPIGHITIGEKAILIQDHNTKEVGEINEENFEDFKSIIVRMFCLTSKENRQYNPSGDLAKKIADKLKKGRQMAAKLAPEKKITIFQKYISGLAVGQKKDMNTLFNYTVYQLLDEFQRYQLKSAYDFYMTAKIQGCSGMDEPQDWLKDIHQ